MRHHVSIAHVSEETLDFLGYFLIAEDDDHKLYHCKGEHIIVAKDDPYLYVEDWNDAELLKGDVMSVPDTPEDC